MTEACWNNNKVNVFPVQTDAPLMGCRANFLLSESGRQSNRHSNHNPSHLWALRGNIHVPHYHPLCLMVYRDFKKTTQTQICFILREIATYAHTSVLTTDSQRCPRRVTSGEKCSSACCLMPVFVADARTALRCCSFAARATACSATRLWGRATSACSSSRTRQ